MGSAESAIVDSIYSRWSDNQTVTRAHQAVTDTLAIAVAGTHSNQARVASATIVRTPPGPGQTAALWADGTHAALAEVAYVLGTGTHSLDWDDYMHPMHGHCSAVLLSTLWPLAEAGHSSGAEFVDAFLAGYQANWLTSLALSHAHYRRGWHATSTIGTIGAAAAASRLLGLDRPQASVALAIAASSAAGVRANFGTMTKAFHAGAAARAGVQAALLARAGATASPDWLLGASGMLDCFGGEHSPERALQEVLDGARSGIHGITAAWGLVQKLYPCCGSIHGALDATLEIIRGKDLRPDDITEIVAHVDPLVLQIMRVDRPTDQEAARYSPTWLVAAAAVDRELGTRQVGDDALSRADIHAMRDRVRVVADLAMTNDTRFGGRVEVAVGQERHVAHTDHPSGHPEAPLSSDQAREKALVALRTVMGDAAAGSLAAAIQGVTEVGSIATLGDAIRLAIAGA